MTRTTHGLNGVVPALLYCRVDVVPHRHVEEERDDLPRDGDKELAL